MKKLYIILLLAFSFPVFAQDLTFSDQVYLGIGGNFNSVWITNQNTYGEPELDYKIKFGYGVNLNFGYEFSPNWGVKTEVGYMTMGQKYEDTQYDIATTRDINLSFLQIPVLLKFRTGGENVRFYIAAGPQINLLLSAKQEYLRGGNPAPLFNGIDVSQENIKDRYQPLNMFLRGDLGVDIDLSEKLFMNLGVSVAYGVTDANKSSWRFYTTSQAFSNGDFYISHNMYAGLNLGINYKF